METILLISRKIRFLSEYTLRKNHHSMQIHNLVHFRSTLRVALVIKIRSKFPAEKQAKVGSPARLLIETTLENNSVCSSADLDIVIKYFKEDLLQTRTVVSKNMWKREKIGSTSRIGPDNILPFVKFDPESLNKIINNLVKNSVVNS